MWRVGPLPPDIWHYGGVVLRGYPGGFFFADFCGDHATLVPGGGRVEPDEVEMWCNCLVLPPRLKGRLDERRG